jgi:cytochrome c5
MSGRNVFMFALPVAAATLLVVGSERVISAAPAAAIPAVAAAGQDDKGESVMNQSCAGCHDLRPIQSGARDKNGWNDVVHNMLQKGADIADADIPVLVDYLAAHFGPMPEGRGKDVVLNVCTMCHDLKRVRQGRRSPQEWMETLNSMLNEGAPLSDADYPVVLAYLSTNFAQ